MVRFASCWPALLLLGSCLSTLRQYQLQEYHYYSSKVPPTFDQYRISLISDLHVWDPHYLQGAKQRVRQARFDLARLREIGKLLQSQRSDLVLLAGDYVSYRKIVRPAFALRPYFRALFSAFLQDNSTGQPHWPRDGIVAVLGNHDHFLLPRNEAHNPLVVALRDSGVVVLANQRLQVPSRQDPTQVLHILGIDDYMFGIREQPATLLQGLQPKDFVLAMAHNPDSFDLLPQPTLIDIALAGHLHGGQVTLFGLAPAVPAQRKYLRQPLQTVGFPVLVSNGLGASLLQWRVMAPPQIWTITLHRHSVGLNAAGPNNLNNSRGFWQAERKRLQAQSALPHAKVVPPKYPQQAYRIIKLSGPAKKFGRYSAAPRP